MIWYKMETGKIAKKITAHQQIRATAFTWGALDERESLAVRSDADRLLLGAVGYQVIADRALS